MAAPERLTEPRLHKSPSAFRTISEVSTELDVPQHVLRFWETKFSQLRPLKRGGGRRYYRPEDVELLGRIRELLYRDGYTIKGVQRLFRNDTGRSARASEPQPDANPAVVSSLQPQPKHGAEAVPQDRRAALESVLRDLLEIREILHASDRSRRD